MPEAIAYKEVTLNPDKQLYVISAGEGYSCWGYQVAFDETVQLASKLGEPLPEPDLLGTLELYAMHGKLVHKADFLRIDLGTWFHLHTPQRVQKAIEQARKTKQKVRIWYGDMKTGKSWMDECDTVGLIGRSSGTLKIPLILDADGTGGPGILDHCIIRIRDEESGYIIYSHPRFHVPELHIRRYDHPTQATGLKWETYYVDGDQKSYSRHYTYSEACGLIAWMNGDEIKKVLDSGE